MKFYKNGTKWVVGQYTIDSGTCYKIESADGLRLELKMAIDNKTIASDKYINYTNAAGTAYTKDQVNALLEDFLNPDVGVAGGCVAVTPHDTNLLPHIGWFEVWGNAGNVAFVDAYGNPSLVRPFDYMECSKVRVKQILATGTTATNINLYY